MIAEPYICIRGPKSGEIAWFECPDCSLHHRCNEGIWQRYDVFERGRLRVMGIEYIRVCTGGYTVNFLGTTGWYDSGKLLGYYCTHYNDDSESGRLLKRAEFLKAVCEKEGVEFLPKEKCGCTCHGFWCKVRSCNACPCHKKPEGSTLKSVVAYRLCTCNDIQKHDILETCPDCMGIRKSSRILNDL